MKDVSLKPDSQRRATASAELLAPPHCLEMLRTGQTEKGDPLKTARVAGILAAKRTDELIPLCHPLPIYRADVEFEIEADCVRAIATVETIAATGVEMEALTAASIAVLTIYDMLKPYCEPAELCIRSCKLDEKLGGKSHFVRQLPRAVPAALLVISDAILAGRKPDEAGRGVEQELRQAGFAPLHYELLPDDGEQLRARVEALRAGNALIITLGGTGLGKRDLTVDVLRPLIQRELPGLMEAARSFGQRRTPYAALSRGVAGFCADNTLLVTLPGSRGGARESMAAILPALVHVFAVRRDLTLGK
ncbi:molybdenum cofactor biosynthesis protein MoaC [Solimonas aquatica]|uniref:Molybdopterin adenylyltransferase n=1 Tax=Solimonas aquatica TaxID=489703 RepID=A0A1H9KHJ3_9GAMM|nr:bifunctional molybdenum cofactor biosynthesis protein MoaC/MoaB [Solimonas aquatica]SEQ98397.1 molybdenum cofactor biosynthesis protein MoaC [Solimonas aquatica]